MKNYYTIEDRVHTTDNWYPTRNDNTVAVSLIINNEPKGFRYRVVVSGEDDLMVYRDFYKEEELTSAYNLFNCLVSHEDLTLHDCHNLSLKG